MRWFRFALSLTMLFVADMSSADDLGGRFDAVELRDCFGRVHQFRELTASKVVVVAFLGTECPLAKMYGSRLQALSERFQNDGVSFVGVCSNVQDSLTETVTYTNKAGISFPMLMDNEQVLADLLQAERTPEVFVLDESRVVLYRGRIDDQYGISVARTEPTREDLVEAIQSAVKGEMPSVASTSSVGCVIGRRNSVEPHGDITFTRHIAPIFNAHCVECHRAGEIAPFPLTSFEETVGWARA